MTDTEQQAFTAGQITRVAGPTILAGQSLSAALDLTGATLLRINAARNWKSALLTFQVSSDGTQWWDLFDRQGNEFLCAVQPNACNFMDPNRTLSAVFVKFRSGLRDGPIIQPADAAFSVVVRGN